MNPIIKVLSELYHIKPEARAAIEAETIREDMPAGTRFLEEGQVCRHLYFVEKGAVRAFHYKDGREVTGWFGFENVFVTSFHSFIDQKPGFEYLETLEDTVFWVLSRSRLYQLYNEFPEIERLGRITCEQYYIRLEDRHVRNHFKNASARYWQLLEDQPAILQRVSLKHIASYLGISQETLSRIRLDRNQ